MWLCLQVAVAAVAAPQQYLIAPGDVISVTVFDEPELSVADIRVPSSGVIAYPLLGRVEVKDHTESSLERHVTALLLDGYLKKPKVSVTITRYRPFFVSGDVDQPGQHAYAEAMNLEKALALAGGPRALDESVEVQVSRDGEEALRVHDPGYSVLPGDVISVKRHRKSVETPEETKQYIYLYGEVRSPGSYDYRQGLTVEQAVALAGGFTDRASKRKIDVSRYRDGQEPEKLKRVKLYFDIMPGDVITVGASLF
jgi:polysaccharide export outer membrane protein